MMRTTIIQTYVDVTEERALYPFVPHIAVHLWDAIVETAHHKDYRAYASACFMYAQKLCIIDVLDIEDLEAIFSASRDDILRCEKDIFNKVGVLDICPHRRLMRLLRHFPRQLHRDVLIFFNLSLFFKLPVCVRTDAAVDATLCALSRSASSHSNPQVRQCTDDLLAQTRSGMGVRTSLLASAAVEPQMALEQYANERCNNS